MKIVLWILVLALAAALGLYYLAGKRAEKQTNRDAALTLARDACGANPDCHDQVDELFAGCFSLAYHAEPLFGDDVVDLQRFTSCLNTGRSNSVTVFPQPPTDVPFPTR